MGIQFVYVQWGRNQSRENMSADPSSRSSCSSLVSLGLRSHPSSQSSISDADKGAGLHRKQFVNYTLAGLSCDRPHAVIHIQFYMRYKINRPLVCTYIYTSINFYEILYYFHGQDKNSNCVNLKLCLEMVIECCFQHCHRHTAIHTTH